MNIFRAVHQAVDSDGAGHVPIAAFGRLYRQYIPTKAVLPAPVTQLPVGRRPLVSVIIPCFNYGRFLPDSVGSALAQDGVMVEVIVVDDASTDDSAAVADKLATADSRVLVIRNERNAGHVVTFNNGLAKSNGEFIVRLDADDLLSPGSLSPAVALFDAFPNVGLVYGHPRHFESEVPPIPRTEVRGWTVWSGQTWLAERCRLGVNCITTPEAIIRGTVMRAMGGLDTRLTHAQDMEMWFRVAAVSDVGHVDGPDQALHRDHSGSMSVTVRAGIMIDLRERRTVFEVLFDGAGARLPASRFLRQQAMKTLCGEALGRACHAYDRGTVAEQPVDELIAFAQEVYPRYHELPEWRSLRRRIWVGPRFSRYIPGFFAHAVIRRTVGELRYLRWARTGI